MLKDKIVCVRLKRSYHEDPNWAYIGKCVQWSDDWIAVHGKGVMIMRGRNRPVEIDKELRPMVFPRENIMGIRVLPDDFSVKTIDIGIDGSKLTMTVPGGAPCVIAEVGE